MLFTCYETVELNFIWAIINLIIDDILRIYVSIFLYYYGIDIIFIITTSFSTKSEQIPNVIPNDHVAFKLSCWLKFREEVERKLVAVSQLYSQSYCRVEIE